MEAGALRTVLADEVWTPERAEKRGNNRNGRCVLCDAPRAGVEHVWWTCPALRRAGGSWHDQS
eukprot:10214229-Heterocapsa_arctica.AAC.2